MLNLGGLKLPASFIKKATSKITDYLEELREHKANSDRLPVWINTYSRTFVKGEKETKQTVINFTVIEDGKFRILESHSPKSLLGKNPLISTLVPMVNKMLHELETQHQDKLVMSILNEYPETGASTVIRFAKMNTGEVIKELNIAEIDQLL